MYSGDGLGLVEVARETCSNLADAVASANRILPGDYITDGTTTADYPSVEMWVVSDDNLEDAIYKRIIIGVHVYTCDYTDIDK